MLNINMTSSLGGLLPVIGLRLQTLRYNGKYNFYRYTGSKTQHFVQCEECGIFFIYSTYSKNRVQHYCSKSCARKAQWRAYNERKKKLLNKYVQKHDITEFYKKYNNFAIGYIYNTYDKEYAEDLIDCWNDEIFYVFAKIDCYERKIGRKSNNYAFIKKFLHFKFLSLSRREKRRTVKGILFKINQIKK